MNKISKSYKGNGVFGRIGFRWLSLVFTIWLLTASVGFLGAGAASEKDGDARRADSMELPLTEPMVSGGRRLTLVATTGFIGEAVLQVAGTKADLTILMPPGTNPHAYSPSPRDVSKLQAADMVFVNGLDLEEALIAVLESLDGPVVVPVSAGIEVLGGHVEDEHDEHGDEGGDPHFWLSPLNLIRWTENIQQVLGSADPVNREYYRESADAYIRVLENLDREVRDMTAAVPPSARKLVTDHLSFGYFARDYGFEILGSIIPSTSDQAEPSARQVTELVDMVIEKDIRAIFVGENAPRGVVKLAESVSGEIGRNIPVVTLLTGSLAAVGERGDNYPDFIRYNTEIIAAALR